MLTTAEKSYYDLDRHDITALCKQVGVSSVHTKKVMNFIYRPGAKVNELQLPKKLLHFFHDNYHNTLPKIAIAHVSQDDQSVKFALELADGEQVEAVLMPEKTRLTLCVSSQVGCKRACSFCHTGRMGLKRNLRTAEIIGQVMVANQWITNNPAWHDKLSVSTQCVTNIVFMGMGEPLDNFDALVKAVDLMTDASGLNLAPRKISVSSSGHLDGLRKLRRIFPSISIAVSLHATEEKTRRQIMPITRQWSLQDILNFINECIEQSPERLPLIQYTMIAGVNDREDDAHRLVSFFKSTGIKINLIPFNTVEPSNFKTPSSLAIQKFRDILHHNGVRSLIRYSKGQDIQAACGQLVI